MARITSVYVLLASAIVGMCAAPVVNLGYAQYQGVLDSTSGNTHFLGMRYAAPPTGSLRWNAPAAPATVSGVQQAVDQPPRCLQSYPGFTSTNPYAPINKKRAAADTEDCLYLNVYVPGALGSKTNLPVVVWIHGGGYVQGGATGFTGTDIQNGDDLIKDGGNGVIVVVIQYRLGVFGFLPGAKVKAGGALNAGLLDQQFALKWVQSQISKFGGNPALVSIWGESAGAGSVIQHVVANGGKTTPQLFRGAITSSTYLPPQYAYNDTIPESLYSQTVTMTGCSSAADTLACLRTIDAATLNNVNIAISTSAFYATFIWSPVVDGTFIQQRPTLSLRQGKTNGKAVYSVTNSHEGLQFINPATTDLKTYIANLYPKLTNVQITAAALIYAQQGSTVIDQAAAVIGEAMFICPTYPLLRAFNGSNYKGEFAIPPGIHSQDLNYYFTSLNANGVPPYANADFDKAFAQSFLAFARSLNPGTKFDPTNVTPAWSVWSSGRTEMYFGETDAGAPDIRAISTDWGLIARCAFWEVLGPYIGQ